VKTSDVITDILSRRDPRGYYVIPAKREALGLVSRFEGVEVEEAGDIIVVRVKARSAARRIALMLSRRGLLVTEF
jgi:hypothetical protein